MKRGPRKLGAGEYTFSALAARRGYFFKAVFEVQPQTYYALMAPLSDLPDEYVEICDRRLAAYLGQFIKKWGERWRLTDEWCFKLVATLMLCRHYSDPADGCKLLGVLDWFGLTGWMAAIPRVWPCFYFPSPRRPTKPEPFWHWLRKLGAWEVDTWPFVDYEAEVRAIVEERLGAYRASIEARARFEHFERTPAIRSPTHYRWLAGYQICGWSKNRISGANRRDGAGVIRAIDHLADEIELTLRPAASNDRSWTVARIRTRLADLYL